MMIELYCSCGRTIRLPERYVGRAAACPGCRRRIRGVAVDYQPGAGAFDAGLFIVTGPRHQGEQIILGGRGALSVGKSDDQDIRLRDEAVSRSHCRLVRGEYGWRIEDSDSKNGVLVNGRQVRARNLHDGDMVRIGSFDLRYVATIGPPPVVVPTKNTDGTDHATGARAPAAAGQSDAHADGVARGDGVSQGDAGDESADGQDDELTLIEDEAQLSMTATATAAISPQPGDSPPIGLADDDLAGPVDGSAAAVARSCPDCGASLQSGARLCVACGFDLASGKRIAGAHDRPDRGTRRSQVTAALSGELAGFVSDCVSCAMFFTQPSSLLTFLMVSLLAMAAVFVRTYVVSMLGFGLFSLAGLVTLQGLICAYLFGVMQHAAAGNNDLPEFSLGDGIVDGVIAPLVKFFFAAALCVAPAVIYAVMLGVGLFQSVRQGVTGVSILLALGGFFWPIVMLVLGLGGLGCLLRPDLLVRTVMRTIIAYLLTFVLLAVVVIMRLSLEYVLRRQGAMSGGAVLALTLALELIHLYAAVVAMQVIGMYYYHFKNRFAWSWG